MSRYWNSYFVSNGALMALYWAIRFFVQKPSDLFMPDEYLPKSLALNREFQVIVTGTVLVFAKFIKSPTWEFFWIHFFFFYKSCFVILLYFANIWAMIWYLNLCLAVWMMFKMKIHFGPHKFFDVRSISEFEEEVLKTKEAWVLLFYSENNLECIGTMSLWCDLSMKYSTKGLRFGKVCVDDSNFLAKKCVIDSSSYSRQLPTLVVYSKGKEIKRFPPVSETGEVSVTVNYKVKEIVKYLGIDRLHLATRDN